MAFIELSRVCEGADLMLRIWLAVALVGGPVLAQEPSRDKASSEELTPVEQDWVRGAAVIAVARIEEVGPAPTVRTGIAHIARQPVVYTVEHVLRGSVPASKFSVFHIVVGPPTADPDPDMNRLSPAVFRKGRRVIVGASWMETPGTPHTYILYDDNEVIGPLDVARLEAVRGFLKMADKSK